MTEPYPNIGHSYTYSEFDKDMGRVETTVSIEQDGGSITITEVRKVNGVGAERKTEQGRISARYPKARLVQIIMDDGERVYYNTNTREIDNSAELIFRRSSFPGFDYKNRDHARLIYRHLHAIASVFLQTPPLLENIDVVWTRQDMSEQGHLGDFLRFDATLLENKTDADWFGVWITVCCVPAPSSVRTYLRREGGENWDIVVKCPPEWHPKINGVIDGIMRAGM